MKQFFRVVLSPTRAASKKDGRDTGMKRSIRQKLLLSTTLLLLALYLVVCILVTIVFQNILINQVYDDHQKIMTQSMQQVNTILKLSDMTMQQVITEESLSQQLLESLSEDNEYPYITMAHVSAILQKYASLNPFIFTIATICSDLPISSRGVGMSSYVQDQYYSSWFSDFRCSNQKQLISPVHQIYMVDNYKDGISLAYKFRNLEQQEFNENYLIIDIPLYQFQNALKSNLLILDNNGNTVVTSSAITPADVAEDEEIIRLDDYIVLKSTMPETGWDFFTPIPRQEFNSSVYGMTMLLVLAFLLVLVITITFLSRSIIRITNPVNTIKTAMQNAYSGNLDVSADVKSGDELEILANCFNKLIEDLKDHIERIIENEEIRKQMQADLMMSQIHPHFIYNTLNSVVYLIEEDNGEGAIETVYSLIAILQNVVKIGSRQLFTTIENELKLLRAYIKIEEVRYPDLFTVELRCEEILLEEPVPQVMIQPLVENALFHGILPTQRKGRISVEIFREKSSMIIQIEDDGIGISEDEMETLMKKSSSSIHGIGLSNIKNRVQFLYNAAGSDFTIRSIPEQGTFIRIQLPLDKTPPAE